MAGVEVSTNGTADDDLGTIAKLVGPYVVTGEHHGRRTYQKSQTIPGHGAIRVVLYLWDARDGEGHSGWWFGDSVGGSQVWSRNPSNAWSPPKAGWRVPWNGE